MKAMCPLFCIAAVAACDDNTPPQNGSITGALKPGMTEQQVAEVSNNRGDGEAVCLQSFHLRWGAKGRCTTRSFRSFWRMSGDKWKVSQWL